MAKTKLEELLEKVTPGEWYVDEDYVREVKPYDDTGHHLGIAKLTKDRSMRPHSQWTANAQLIALAPALARSHEALASTLKRVFSNMAKFDSHSEDGKLYVRCIYCNAIGCFESGKSTGYIPHKEHCLIAVAEKVLAEA